MIIRGFVIAATVLVSCQAFAQAPMGSPFVPTDIQQLREALTTGTQQQGQLIEIPAELAKDWLQASDQPTWTAIQQGRPTKIDLESLLGQQSLPEERLTDGIDPFAIYDANGGLRKIWIRAIGVNPSTFVDATINEARERGESTKVLTATDGEESRSSLAQKLVNKAQEAADAICELAVKPEQVSVSVGVPFVFAVEATFKTATLCNWLS